MKRENIYRILLHKVLIFACIAIFFNGCHIFDAMSMVGDRIKTKELSDKVGKSIFKHQKLAKDSGIPEGIYCHFSTAGIYMYSDISKDIVRCSGTNYFDNYKNEVDKIILKAPVGMGIDYRPSSITSIKTIMPGEEVEETNDDIVYNCITFNDEDRQYCNGDVVKIDDKYYLFKYDGNENVQYTLENVEIMIDSIKRIEKTQLNLAESGFPIPKINIYSKEAENYSKEISNLNQQIKQVCESHIRAEFDKMNNADEEIGAYTKESLINNIIKTCTEYLSDKDGSVIKQILANTAKEIINRQNIAKNAGISKELYCRFADTPLYMDTRVDKEIKDKIISCDDSIQFPFYKKLKAQNVKYIPYPKIKGAFRDSTRDCFRLGSQIYCDGDVIELFDREHVIQVWQSGMGRVSYEIYATSGDDYKLLGSYGEAIDRFNIERPTPTLNIYSKSFKKFLKDREKYHSDIFNARLKAQDKCISIIKTELAKMPKNIITKDDSVSMLNMLLPTCNNQAELIIQSNLY